MKYFISFFIVFCPCILFAQGIGKNPDGTKYKYGDYQTKKDQYNYSATHPSSSADKNGYTASDSPPSIEDLKRRYDEVGSFNYGFARVRKGNKYGYINRDGRVIIPIDYEYAHDVFSEGLVGVLKDKKWGFFDDKGSNVIPLIYDRCNYFFDGFARVTLKGEDFKIDKKGKRQVLTPAQIKFLKEDLVLVEKDNKWGFGNREGTLIIPLLYDEAKSFDRMDLARVKQNGKWGAINKEGKIIIPVLYDDIESLFYELTRVKQNSKYGFVNSKGEIAVPVQYDYTGMFFYDDLCEVRKEDKNGYVDTKGNVIIPLIYEKTNSFKDGLAEVKLNGITFRIDKKGNREVVRDPNKPFHYTDNISEGLAVVEDEKKYGFIDQYKTVVIPLTYDSAAKFRNGLAMVVLKGKCGYINPHGKIIIPLQYNACNPRFSNGLIGVKQDNKWGFIDEEGVVKIPFQEFDEVGPYFFEELVEVRKAGKWGFMDKRGKLVIPCIYDAVTSFYHSQVSVRLNGEVFKIDNTGKRVL